MSDSSRVRSTDGGERGHRYAQWYCEENVWHLCRHPDLAGLPAWVVFVSNPLRRCTFFRLRACEQAGTPADPVVFDYHVFAVTRHARDEPLVWDPDSLLGLPVPLSVYLRETFGGDPAAADPVPEMLGPCFRVLPADDFLRAFSSDRSHMQVVDPEGDRVWLAPPPPWPPITRAGEPTNLMRFVDMTTPFLGIVTGMNGLAGHLSA